MTDPEPEVPLENPLIREFPSLATTALAEDEAGAVAEEAKAALAELRGSPLGQFRDLLRWLLQRQSQFERARFALKQLEKTQRGLIQQLRILSQPPRPVARLVSVQARQGRAWVATNPGAILEVGLDPGVALADLLPGSDVVLSQDRTAILRADARAPLSAGTERMLPFLGWVSARDEGEALRRALTRDGDREATVFVRAELGAEVEARLEAADAEVRLVDGYSHAVQVCVREREDARAMVARFRTELAPVPGDQIIGLRRNLEKVRAAVQAVPERGAFVLCEGPPGCGKTHLAGHALHLLQQDGTEVVVLALKAKSEHRYYRQEESDVEDLCRTAEALARSGKRVLVFLDEVDRFFFRSRLGASSHDNASRATWLALLGGGMRLDGVLFYATTNKAAHLPDELVNRATHLATFEPMDAETARGLLRLHRTPDRIVDAIVESIFDESPASCLAEVVLRDQSVVAIHPRDLRQTSARFFRELARDQAAASAKAGGPGEGEHAVARAWTRLRETVRALGLRPDNVAERTFLSFDPKNPPDQVRLVSPPAATEAVFLRYEPLELSDALER